MKTNSIRSRLLTGTICASALIAGAASAQTKVAAADTAADTGEIVVTGSIIKNPNLTRSAPVNVTTAEEITLRQSNTAEELLRDLPGAVPSIGSAVNNGNGGASYVDLRGLGSFRNIVLLDGARIAPSGLVGRVDLNNIPLALVERVEVLTGGASTTYGADAISGVVNYITKKDFSGVEASIGQQLTQSGDGSYLRADVTIGANFDDNKGNATLSIGYQKSDPVYQGDRDYGAYSIDSFSGTVGGSGTSVPARFTFSGGGRAATDPLRVTGNRQVFPVATGGNGGVNPAVGTYALFNFNPYNIYQTPFQRYNLFASARYEVNDNLEVYTRGLFSKNNVKTIIAPSGSFGATATINVNNPYLPAALRTQFCNNQDFDLVTAGIQPLTTAQCAAAATATGPGDPNYRVFSTAIGRRLVEAGPRISDFSTTVFDYKVGVRGAITESLSYDLSGAYGESENRQTLQGYVLTSRLRQALLADNTLSCTTNTNGCVPLNIFGAEGSITPAMASFLQAESTTLVKTSLGQVRGQITGDFGGLAVPGAKDPISFGVGGEYRKYTASQQSDLLAQTAGELGGAGGAAPNIDGGYSVYEAFGEVIAPLVQDVPFFQSLTLEAGVRYSHYTVDAPSNPSYNATTWKVGGSWEPVAGVKVRGNYSRAVRAPNISELFTPVTVGLTNLATDPCAGNAPNVNANLRAICLAQGAPAFTIGSIQNPTAGQANITTGGNVNVLPETSNSYTAGVVLQPSFLPGFNISVDYYHIKIDGAITVPTPGDLMNACFGTTPLTPPANAANPSCTQIRRNPATGGLDGSPDTTGGLFGALTNLGELNTDGIDVILNYTRDIGFAKLGLSFNGNYTFHSKFNSNPNDPTALNRECIGYYSVNCSNVSGSIIPQFSWSQRTTLGFDAFDISLLWRHLDSVQQEPEDIINGNGPFYQGNLTIPATGQNFGTVDFQHIKAYDYFDLSGRFNVFKTLTLTVTVANLFDKKPPIVGNTAGSTSFNSGNTYPSTYDALGRRFKIGASVRF